MAKVMNKSATGNSDKKPMKKVAYKQIGENLAVKRTATPRRNSVTSGAITGATTSGMAKKRTATKRKTY